jgi:hypothetical protein
MSAKANAGRPAALAHAAEHLDATTFRPAIATPGSPGKG